MSANDPFAGLPEVPSFRVTSATVTDGSPVPRLRCPGCSGCRAVQDVSPELSWEGAPEGTQGYAVTVYDPDAPTHVGVLALGGRRHPGQRDLAG